MMRACGLLVAFVAPAACADAGAWVRPERADAPLIWGRTDGSVFGLASAGGMRGPRGLIRVGIWNAKTGQPEKITFISIDPVTEGAGSRFSRTSYSELEPSGLDPGLRGKRLSTPAYAGELVTFPARPRPIEQLSVRIDVEPFSNGLHIYLVARMQSDRPEEIAISVHHHPGSPNLEELTLDATMGNFERLRYLWLKDRVIDSRALYDGYTGNDFVQREDYPVEEILKTPEGDAIALCTTNEADPAKVAVGHAVWEYRFAKLTQYWRVRARHIQPDLRVNINGRRVYWNSQYEIPGGVAFESFQMRQRYVPGQEFIFGLTTLEPWQFKPKLPRLAPPPAPIAE